MKLEAIVVCKDYSDFLEHTLPSNMQHFDRLVVVTHPDDKATLNLCTKYGVDVIPTKEFHRNEDKFNKGRAINLGLSHLRHDGWLLHLDADILLPHNFRKLLNHANLNEKFIYGADRMNTLSYDHWIKHKDKIAPAHHYRYMVNAPREFPMASRLLHEEYGYCPIGFFQLWHSKTHRKYPIVNGSAEHGDVLFSVQWPRDERALLPEVIVYHLESNGNAPMGVNWNGRRTPPFGPSKPSAPHHPPMEIKSHHKPCTPHPCHHVEHHHHHHHHGYRPKCDKAIDEAMDRAILDIAEGKVNSSFK